MRLSKFRTRLRSIACVAAVAGLLTGCSGSSNTSASGGTTPPVTGIATPSSVSVVTATK
jgi:hypothetical protein